MNLRNSCPQMAAVAPSMTLWSELRVTFMTFCGISVAKDCSNLSTLPTVTFSIDSNKYPLAGSDYVLQIEGECLMGIAAMDFPKGFNYVILGDVFMRKYPSTFNLDNNTVSFAV